VYRILTTIAAIQGVSYSLSSITFPSLLHLPTAQLASQTHAYIRTNARAAQRYLSILSISTLTLAFILSPSRSRHPYLLWTSLIVGLGAAPRVVEKISARIASTTRQSGPTERASRLGELDESGVIVGQSSGSEDEDDVNGEVVRRAVQKSQLLERVKTGFWGLGFLMGVVGLWGDGA
jgi:autophagy-related protein 33